MLNIRYQELLRALELKVPPPLVAALVAAAMWIAAWAAGSVALPWAARVALGVSLFLLGTAFRMAAQFSFVRARTTINPLDPGRTSSMVTSGLYGISRNPMYLGRAIQLLGWAMFLASPAAMLVWPAYPLYVTRFQVIPEERSLKASFGALYEDYKNKVPRWL